MKLSACLCLCVGGRGGGQIRCETHVIPVFGPFSSFLNLKNHSFSAYFLFHHKYIKLHVHKLMLNYEFEYKD